MNWGAIMGIIVMFIIMALYEWPKINQNQKKEKVAFVVIISIGFTLAILLNMYPNMPGPTQLVEVIYKPFSKILEK
jgi:multisubunit Na+/H+ antiporter MnhB subunit